MAPTLRGLGELIAKKPKVFWGVGFTVSLVFCLGWLRHGAPGDWDMVNDEEFEMTWSGPKAKSAVTRRMKDKAEDWEFQVQPMLMEADGKDMLNSEYLDDILTAHKVFYDTKVNVSNEKNGMTHEFGVYDFCVRGALPDKPLGFCAINDEECLKGDGGSYCSMFAIATLQDIARQYMGGAMQLKAAIDGIEQAMAPTATPTEAATTAAPTEAATTAAATEAATTEAATTEAATTAAGTTAAPARQLEFSSCTLMTVQGAVEGTCMRDETDPKFGHCLPPAAPPPPPGPSTLDELKAAYAEALGTSQYYSSTAADLIGMVAPAVSNYSPAVQGFFGALATDPPAIDGINYLLSLSTVEKAGFGLSEQLKATGGKLCDPATGACSDVLCDPTTAGGCDAVLGASLGGMDMATIEAIAAAVDTEMNAVLGQMAGGTNDFKDGCFPVPMLGCASVTPMGCFAEELFAYDETTVPKAPRYEVPQLGMVGDAAFSTSFLFFDPLLEHIPALAPLVPWSYSNRKSYHCLTDEEIKAEVWARPNGVGKRGCSFWTRGMIFGADIMLGATVRETSGEVDPSDNTQVQLDKVGAIGDFYLIDGPARAHYRMGMARPEVELEDVVEGMKAFKRKWMQTLLDLDEKGTMKTNLYPFLDDSLDDVQEELESPPWLFIILGAFAMNVFVKGSTLRIKQPLVSKSWLCAVVGLTTVGLSIMTSFGFFALVGLKYNMSMMQSIPFLAMGLGIDDVFILSDALSAIPLERIKKDSMGSILAEVMHEAGASITLTTLCNVTGFLCILLIPVSGVKDFGVGMAITALINYFLVITIFSPCMTLEVKRIKANQPEQTEFTCCQKRYIVVEEPKVPGGRRNSQLGGRGSCVGEAGEIIIPAGGFQMPSFMEKTYAPRMASKAVSAVLTLISLGLFAACLMSAMSMDVGYVASDLVPVDNPVHHAWNQFFDNFQYFPGQIILADQYAGSSQRLDVATMQPHILNLLADVEKRAGEFEKQLVVPITPPLIAKVAEYAQLVGALPCAAVPECAANVAAGIEAGEYPPEYAGAMMGQLDPRYTLTMDGLSPEVAGKYLNEATRELGLVMPENFDSILHEFRAFPATPQEAFTSQAFLAADFAGANNCRYTREDEDAETVKAECKADKSTCPKLTYMPIEFEMTSVKNTEDYVNLIEMMKAAIADAKGGVADVTFGDSIPHTYWGVFFDLKGYFWTAFAADISVIFLWTLIFLRSPTAAFACALTACTIVVELYGVLAMFTQWNIFTASTLLMGMGISIEFVAHIVASYELLRDVDIESRIGETCARAFPPILKGTFSTFLAVCGLAFSPIPLFVKYFFLPLLVLCLVGLVNALVFLPATLVCVTHIKDCIFPYKDDVQEIKVGGGQEPQDA